MDKWVTSWKRASFFPSLYSAIFCNASKNNQFDNAKIIYSDENSVFLKQ